MLDAVKLGFIGGGNIASCLIGGLRRIGVTADMICVADPSAEQRERLADRWGVVTSEDNVTTVHFSDILVLAVKPQVMKAVCTPLVDEVRRHRPLILSVAAGLATRQIDGWLGGGNAVVRAMPNTPALVDIGAAGLFANERVSAEQCRQAQALMDAVGLSEWVDDEALMDVVTAISGSGPAYFFLTIEMLAEAGVAAGLPSRVAHRLAAQTALGAGTLLMDSRHDAATLRQRVTSEGGTTERALNILEAGHIREVYRRAIDGAIERGRELAADMEDEQG